jgi:hypothetical protein
MIVGDNVYLRTKYNWKNIKDITIKDQLVDSNCRFNKIITFKRFSGYNQYYRVTLENGESIIITNSNFLYVACKDRIKHIPVSMVKKGDIALFPLNKFFKHDVNKFINSSSHIADLLLLREAYNMHHDYDTVIIKIQSPTSKHYQIEKIELLPLPLHGKKEQHHSRFVCRKIKSVVTKVKTSYSYFIETEKHRDILINGCFCIRPDNHINSKYQFINIRYVNYKTKKTKKEVFQGL